MPKVCNISVCVNFQEYRDASVMKIGPGIFFRLMLGAGYGNLLYKFLIIAYHFTLQFI